MKYETCHRLALELVAETLRAGERVRLRVCGTSMLPNLWPGDVLEIRGRNEVRLDDIVLSSRGELLVCHRVVEIRDRDGAAELVTRGDGLRQCDPPITMSDVLGVVTAICRHGRPVPLEKPNSVATQLIGQAVRPHSPLRPVVLKLHAMRIKERA